MKNLQEFLRSFIQNKGQHVFLSLLIAKLCAFLGSLFIIRLLPENEFGVVSIVASVFAIFAPFSGFGSQQSLLRFGSLAEESSGKKALSKYLLVTGFRYQMLLSIVFLAVSFFFIKKYEDILLMFLFFGVRLAGFFFLNHIQSDLRINGNNRGFARVSNFVNISGLILLLTLSYFCGLHGYLIAMAATPFLCFFWYRKDLFDYSNEIFSFKKKEIWNYGLHASATALLSDMLFSADVLFLSFLTNENAVANYKVAILIPANITFLALTFMQSDFPSLARNYKDKNFLKRYISNYYRIFIPLTIIIFAVGFLWREDILHLFFSAKYTDNSLIFALLLAGFCFNMLLRNLYGNMLSAVGKMKINTAVSAFTLFCLLLFSWFLVPEAGIRGMALSLTVSMLISGVLLLFAFLQYLKSLK
ncbi:oligosaccharide flippase family protein [Chryseobacterium sp.]|uniref:oligosaccharide flippase family protein n=1 Tax=Chryseobacterium sp. TaxID=1871047 RepID=UPI0011CBA155|nr:oligosaccharide flippase family protein [Chryseobacterium sp.]TXF76165.1 oligosaccharide flippase family protein [Chryseobacterium sp.]